MADSIQSTLMGFVVKLLFIFALLGFGLNGFQNANKNFNWALRFKYKHSKKAFNELTLAHDSIKKSLALNIDEKGRQSFGKAMQDAIVIVIIKMPLAIMLDLGLLGIAIVKLIFSFIVAVIDASLDAMLGVI